MLAMWPSRGIVGAGKTKLAVKSCERYSKQWYDGCSGGGCFTSAILFYLLHWLQSPLTRSLRIGRAVQGRCTLYRRQPPFRAKRMGVALAYFNTSGGSGGSVLFSSDVERSGLPSWRGRAWQANRDGPKLVNPDVLREKLEYPPEYYSSVRSMTGSQHQSFRQPEVKQRGSCAKVHAL